MKTPLFWNKKNIVSFLLYPLSLLYYFIYKIRCFINFNPYKSKIPIICIGNIIAGGSGKTPVAIEIAKILKDKNKKFCFLSKGYGGNFEEIVKVDKNISPDVVGDESLILCEYGDTFISKNRINGIKYINNNYSSYDYIIMDDGLQNPTFIKDKIILVIDGKFGFGNNFILPAGPLRDKFKNIYKNIDLVVINNADNKFIEDLCIKNNVNFTNSKINVENIQDFENNEYVAFCGLGRPEKFNKTLIDNKIKVKKFITFADHYKYKNKDIEKLLDYNYKLITTKKDWVKLDTKYKEIVDCLNIYIELDKNKIEDIL